MKITFYGEEYNISFAEYADPKNTAILLTDEEGVSAGMATVNTEATVKDGFVAIKDYSEMQGMLKCLIEGGVIEDEIIGEVPSGFVTIPVVPLTPEAMTEKQKTV